MTSKEIREKYLKFFTERGHKVIPAAPLVPKDDPTTLFTTAGMQPLVPYLLGEPHPEGKRLVNIQPCLRTDDIDEVGDNTHNTFLEMLGNWSLGDYWKKESIEWSLEFLTQELGLKKEKLAVTVFEGDGDAPKDEESTKIWENLGIPQNRIFPLGKKDNWWGPVGNTGPCGPDTEIFYWTGDGKTKGAPNTDNRWVEVWNNVFMEYNKTPQGSYEPLKQKNVDTGMGLERTTAVVQGKDNVYETDLFSESIKALEALRKSGPTYSENPRPYRVIADHLRAAIFIVYSGITPSNKEQGYVLRRLIRRAMVQSRKLGMSGDEWLSNIFSHLVVPVMEYYPPLRENVPQINQIITQEVDRFRKTIDGGIEALKKIYGGVFGSVDPDDPGSLKTQNNILRIDGNIIFKIYETYGLPPEISQEIMTDWGLAFDKKTMDECKEAMKKHKELSRATSAGMFKGGLTSQGETETKYHTATHLLHAALRKVLGDHVIQRGSNITSERMRFDFSHTEKLTPEQIKEVEDLINGQIEKKLPVSFEEMSREEAEKTGAIHAFGEKYGERVKIYSIGGFSKEFCGGPHVANTKEIGHVTITKEESAGSGIRRIYARIEN